jgi:hypothetical protein
MLNVMFGQKVNGIGFWQAFFPEKAKVGKAGP